MSIAQLPAQPTPALAEDEAFWRAWDEFFAALRRARGRAAREQKGGLTLSQYRLLCAVQESPSAGLGELADKVGSAGPTVTRMLTALARDGVITRCANDDGSRRLQVRLTELGTQLLADKHEAIRAKRAAVLASLTPAERRQAEQLLARFVDALEAM